jgi:hypothetical protein
VTIPNSVTSIDSYAFKDNLLTRVTFMGNAPASGSSVFDGNGGLTSVARSFAAIGWSATWSGMQVAIIGGPPIAIVKPTVRGVSAVGKTLSAAEGTWTTYPAPTFTYQWYACTRAATAARSTVPSTCKKITGATRSTLKLTSAQRGKYVTVLVTGTSAGTTRTTWLAKTTTKIR